MSGRPTGIPAGGLLHSRRNNAQHDTAWHVIAPAEALERLGSDAEAGLTSEEAARRLAESGPNELRRGEKTPAWRMFLGQFNDFMIWVLMAAVAISAAEGQMLEAFAITAILILNGVLGFIQEYRAEQSLEALRQLSAPTATVVRGGVEQEVPAGELVPGDIVLIEAGDKIPADGRLIEAAALRVEEASLTGESRAASKSVTGDCPGECALGDRITMVFAGTSVAVGRGRYVVTDTGTRTQMGRIAQLLAEQEEEKTPLQQELKGVGKRIAVLVLAIAAIVFAVGVFQAWHATGESFFAIALGRRASVRASPSRSSWPSRSPRRDPQGLPAIVTVALSLAFVRWPSVTRSSASSTRRNLGSTSFICSDKTAPHEKRDDRPPAHRRLRPRGGPRRLGSRARGPHSR